MEMSLNTAGPSYCTSKGQQFAYEVDHGVPDDKKFFKGTALRKKFLMISNFRLPALCICWGKWRFFGTNPFPVLP